MSGVVTYLSGNVPGGLPLYFLLLLVTFLILYFMYRVNELFTRKHLLRWAVIAFVVYTVLYIVLWFKNPPHQYYKRYHVAILQTQTPDNWFGEYLTDLITDNVQYYRSRNEYLFPYHWLYRITPADSALNEHFTRNVYQKLPMHIVLSGNARLTGNAFQVKLQLMKYPEQRVLKEAQGEFSLDRPDKFLSWVKENFGDRIPFQEREYLQPFQESEIAFTLARRLFYQRKYERSQEILKKIIRKNRQNMDYQKWFYYNAVRLAGMKRLQNPPKNPFSPKIPVWRKKLRHARSILIQLLKREPDDLFTKVMIAESYLWDEDFASAEIFLKQAFVENPFDIDVLLNFTFLHPSRYKEFGFANRKEIYQQIVIYCPIEESVLLKWSNLILKGDPAYTPPPHFARDFVERYLKMNPYSPSMWLMLGQLLSQQGDRPAALNCFLKADSLKPGDGLILYNLGVLYYEWEKLDKAKTYFLKSIEASDYLDSHLYLGSIYKRQGNCQAALREFRYRVAHKQGEDDFYAYQAMKGIRECLEMMKAKADSTGGGQP